MFFRSLNFSLNEIRMTNKLTDLDLIYYVCQATKNIHVQVHSVTALK